MVLRLALAQKIGLGTPDHALVATALPLVDGGPRRLVHGVLGTLLRRGLPAIERAAPAGRGRAALGGRVGRGGRRGRAAPDREAPAARPDLSPTMPTRRPMPPSTAASRSRPTMCGSKARRSPSLPGFGEGRWWVQDLAASLAGAPDPGRRRRTCSTSARRPAARRCSSPPPVTGSPRSTRRKVVSDDCARTCDRTHLDAELVEADALKWQPRPRIRRDPARRALLGDRHVPPPSGSPLPRSAATSSPTAPSSRRSCSTALRNG